MCSNTWIHIIIKDFVWNDNDSEKFRIIQEMVLLFVNILLVSEMEIVLDKYAIMCDTA